MEVEDAAVLKEVASSISNPSPNKKSENLNLRQKR
jgi:hypothetical protein